MKIPVMVGVKSCRLLESYQRLGSTICRHVQAEIVSVLYPYMFHGIVHNYSQPDSYCEC